MIWERQTYMSAGGFGSLGPSWSWSYRELWTTWCGCLRTESRSSERAACTINSWAALQPQEHYFLRGYMQFLILAFFQCWRLNPGALPMLRQTLYHWAIYLHPITYLLRNIICVIARYKYISLCSFSLVLPSAPRSYHIYPWVSRNLHVAQASPEFLPQPWDIGVYYHAQLLQ